MFKIIQYPADILKTKCEPVVVRHGKPVLFNSETISAINTLNYAMRNNTDTRAAFGLTAPQVGINARIFVVDKAALELSEEVFVDPVITSLSDNTDFLEEACMSFPDTIRIKVKRSLICTISAYNAEGKAFELTCFGLAAHVMQHEVDHLDGITLYQNATAKGKKDILKKIADRNRLNVRRNSK